MDRDLESIQEARDLLRVAKEAADAFASADQQHVDAIVRSMGKAAENAAAPLAQLAVDETGMGRAQDKVIKNVFSAVTVRDYILPLRTVGIIREVPDLRVKELAVPMGVVAALVPTTNPTSTVIYKALIAVKARNAIVFSPHPRAARCSLEAVDIMHKAAVEAGAPPNLLACMSQPTVDATNELMSHANTAVILATGGSAMVRSAYSSGKPAYGVGPGNVPAIVERTADVPAAVADIVAGKTFDNGLLCSAENSLICDAPVEETVRHELALQRALFVHGEDREKLERVMRDPRTGGVNTAIVGLAATEIAQRAGISVPEDTRALVVECSEVGPREFFSREKLSPVLAFYLENGWERCCDRSIELLQYGGIGHSLVIHSNDEHVIDRFFEEKPAFRILVNTVSAVGAVGHTTGLAPAMTLGPGTWGGSSTSDNITPMHLINVKRLAWGIRPYVAVDAPGRRGDSTGKTGPNKTDRRADGLDEEAIQEAVAAFMAERRTGGGRRDT